MVDGKIKGDRCEEDCTAPIFQVWMICLYWNSAFVFIFYFYFFTSAYIPISGTDKYKTLSHSPSRPEQNLAHASLRLSSTYVLFVSITKAIIDQSQELVFSSALKYL